MPLPHDPALDSTRAFFAEGYEWIGNRCRALGSDAFRARIMLRPVVAMAGEEAARRFYDGQSFTRAGAMPQTTLRQLQDKGSVQSLDGAAHRHRKQLFLSIMAGDPAERWRTHSRGAGRPSYRPGGEARPSSCTTPMAGCSAA
jgi:fatty-acid peroxygenase